MISLFFSTHRSLYATALWLCLGGWIGGWVSGCAQQTEFASFYTPQTLDFSGHWEKNYQASDDLNNKFRLFLFDLQRSINTSNNRNLQGGPAAFGGNVVSNEAITGLAQLTEEITKVALLEIEQDDNSISIDRENNFALTCDYFSEQYVINENPFGSELCGWNGEQLIFQLNMGDGLSIRHQVTMGPDKQEINITTTVSSSAVSTPFTISNYYRRYAPPEYDYECIFTLSRNNVCSQNGS